LPGRPGCRFASLDAYNVARQVALQALNVRPSNCDLNRNKDLPIDAIYNNSLFVERYLAQANGIQDRVHSVHVNKLTLELENQEIQNGYLSVSRVSASTDCEQALIRTVMMPNCTKCGGSMRLFWAFSDMKDEKWVTEERYEC
jgi:hypothetical protein